MRVVLTGPAQQDMALIATRTTSQYGTAAWHRYRLLIRTALRDLAAKPKRVGVVKRVYGDKEYFQYHLIFSRSMAGHRSEQVNHPRHLIVFQIAKKTLLVHRILHEHMDPARHLS